MNCLTLQITKQLDCRCTQSPWKWRLKKHQGLRSEKTQAAYLLSFYYLCIFCHALYQEQNANKKMLCLLLTSFPEIYFFFYFLLGGLPFIPFPPTSVKWYLDFTLANARRFCSSMGNHLGRKGLSDW